VLNNHCHRVTTQLQLINIIINFHWQSQDICAESESRVVDTGAHSKENYTETTAVVPLQTATRTKYPDNLYSPCILSRIIDLWQILVGLHETYRIKIEITGVTVS
jgi:hypothetical protein